MQTFSTAAIVCAVISTIVIFCVPIALCIYICLRHGKGTFRAVMTGALCFIVGVYVLEQIFHTLVFYLFPSLANNIFAYALYGCLAAGVFEETARLIGLHFLCGRDAAPEIGFAYGVGHGGIEAIIAGLMFALGTLYTMVLVNANGLDYFSGMDSATRSQLLQVISYPAVTFLGSSVERLIAITLHIALSMLVYMVVTGRIGRWGYPLAILFHAIMDFFPGLYQGGVITNIWLVEGLLAVITAAVTAFVVWLYRSHPLPRPAAPTAWDLP